MPKHHEDTIQIGDPLQRTRCPGCGYFHTGTTPLCALCADGTVSIATPLPLLGGGDHDTALPVTPSPPVGDVVMLPPPGSPALHPRRQECRCCSLLHHKALHEALCDPLQTQRTIASRFGVSLHSLTQHRRVCMGLPPFGKQESGQRRQFLRRTATKHQTNPLCPSFVSCVQQELERMEGALTTLAHRITTLQTQHAQLAEQTQALRAYLQLSTQSSETSEILRPLGRRGKEVAPEG